MPPVQIVTHIDATGADPAALARVRMELERMQADLPGKIAGTVKDLDTRTYGRWHR
jgi:hypothetical protein